MNQITIYIAGDSKAADYPDSQLPMNGWGQALPQFVTEEVQVVNAASPGRSSKSFIEEGRLDEIERRIGSGDYLFIQFGHNDQKPDERYTDPVTTYRSYLVRYVETARRHGAQPVLFSSVERRKFDEAGTLLFTHGDYPAAMEQLADELGVPFIDLRRRTRELVEGAGPVESKRWFVWLRPGEHPNYPEGSEDDTHFNVAGAREVARLVAQGLLASALPIKSFIKMPQ